MHNCVTLKPLGLGSTGRTVANSIKEQMVMREALENPGLGEVVVKSLNDKRWFGWSKMQWNNGSITIHYNAL